MARSLTQRRAQTMAEVVILVGIIGMMFAATTLLFPKAFQALWRNARNVLSSPF